MSSLWCMLSTQGVANIQKSCTYMHDNFNVTDVLSALLFSTAIFDILLAFHVALNISFPIVLHRFLHFLFADSLCETIIYFDARVRGSIKDFKLQRGSSVV